MKSKKFLKFYVKETIKVKKCIIKNKLIFKYDSDFYRPLFGANLKTLNEEMYSLFGWINYQSVNFEYLKKKILYNFN